MPPLEDGMLEFMFGHLSALVALIMFVSSFSLKNKNKMLIVTSIAMGFYALSLGLLGGYLGTVLIVIAAVRGIFLFNIDKKKKSYKYIVLGINEILVIVACILLYNYEGWFALVLLASNLLVSFGIWQDNQVFLRVCTLVDGIVCIIYAVTYAAWINIFIEALLIIASIYFIVKYVQCDEDMDKKKANQRISVLQE